VGREGIEPSTLGLRVAQMQGFSALLSEITFSQMPSDRLRIAEFGTCSGQETRRPDSRASLRRLDFGGGDAGHYDPHRRHANCSPLHNQLLTSRAYCTIRACQP